MKVFISWADPETRPFALFLREWLRLVIQSVRPWMSEFDVAKGARGMTELGNELQGAEFGIMVLTAANQDSPWINFEAGAISKSVGESSVIPLLLDVRKSDVVGPLSQFQAVDASDKADVRMLLEAMNSRLPEPLGSQHLDHFLEREWSSFEAHVDQFRQATGQLDVTAERSDRDVLDEILLAVRDINRRSVLAQNPVFQRKSQANKLEGK